MAPARTAIEPLPAYGAVFANVEGQLPGTDLRDWRRAALARFVAQGIPSSRRPTCR